MICSSIENKSIYILLYSMVVVGSVTLRGCCFTSAVPPVGRKTHQQECSRDFENNILRYFSLTISELINSIESSDNKY